MRTGKLKLEILKSSFPFQVTLGDHLRIQILIITANFNTFGKIPCHNSKSHRQFGAKETAPKVDFVVFEIK